MAISGALRELLVVNAGIFFSSQAVKYLLEVNTHKRRFLQVEKSGVFCKDPLSAAEYLLSPSSLSASVQQKPQHSLAHALTSHYSELFGSGEVVSLTL